MNSRHLELLNFQLCHLNSGRLPTSVKGYPSLSYSLETLLEVDRATVGGSLCWLPSLGKAPSLCWLLSGVWTRFLCKLNSVLFSQTGIVFLCAATLAPTTDLPSVIQRVDRVLVSENPVSLRTVKSHVMKETVKQANRTQSKTEKQHTALGRRYFKLTESIFTNATGQHYRQAWSVWFPVRLLLLLLLVCFNKRFGERCQRVGNE